MRELRRLCAVGALLLVETLSGCRSPHIDVTVENRTGAPIQLLEVDYPSASFGTDSLAPGATFHYRIQVRLSGPVKVQYTESATHRAHSTTGTQLFEGQNGRLAIDLLPDGKAEFHPELGPQQ